MRQDDSLSFHLLFPEAAGGDSMGKKYGYVRVSTREQNEDRQLYSMQESGVEKKNIFVDKQSDCSFERPGYLRMMKKLKQGDVLYLHSIDRLGRNYEEILQYFYNDVKLETMK